MPERAFALIQEKDEEDIEEIFAQWMIEMSLRYGGYSTVAGNIV